MLGESKTIRKLNHARCMATREIHYVWYQIYEAFIISRAPPSYTGMCSVCDIPLNSCSIKDKSRYNTHIYKEFQTKRESGKETYNKASLVLVPLGWSNAKSLWKRELTKPTPPLLQAAPPSAMVTPTSILPEETLKKDEIRSNLM